MPERWETLPSDSSAHRQTSTTTARRHPAHRPGRQIHSRSVSPIRQTHSSPSPARQTHSRAPSPVAGEKRSPSPSLDDEVRYAKSANTGTKSRATVSSLPEEEKELAMMAIDLLRCDITVNEAFPDHIQERQMVKKAYKASCNELEVPLRLTPLMYKVISGRFSHTRGELKNKARSIVEGGFGYKTGDNKKVIRHNRKLTEDLKEDLGFAYKDPVARTGLYQHTVFQKVANAMYFANRRDEGPSHPEVFNPFPLKGLALILTAVECCIDEWATGTRVDIKFASAEYGSIYRAHITALEAFNIRGAQFQVVDKILTRMHNVGRFHSGAEPLTDTTPKPILSTDMMDAALKEFENGGGFSDDDDEGEDE
ncbi:hypothetical protein C8F01DRAFT_368943 [Mycena amicta]|nr:hypothetical protein C8F01DRAFT_368943 [Mycena amicta]